MQPSTLVREGVMAKPQAHDQFDGQTVCQVDTVKSLCHSWAQATPLHHSFLASYLFLETFLPEVFSGQYFLYPFYLSHFPVHSSVHYKSVFVYDNINSNPSLTRFTKQITEYDFCSHELTQNSSVLCVSPGGASCYSFGDLLLQNTTTFQW